MKIKKFESKRLLEPGDYVICNVNLGNKNLTSTLNNNVGQFIKFLSNSEYMILYLKDIIHKMKNDLKAKDIENMFVDDYFIAFKKEIKNWSKNKIDLEVQLASKKYNL